MTAVLSRKRRSPANKLTELLWEQDDSYALTSTDLERGWFEHTLIHPRINYDLLVRCRVNAFEYPFESMIVHEDSGLVHVTLGGWETVDDDVTFQYYYRHGGRLVPDNAGWLVLMDLHDYDYTPGGFFTIDSRTASYTTAISYDLVQGSCLVNNQHETYADNCWVWSGQGIIEGDNYVLTPYDKGVTRVKIRRDTLPPSPYSGIASSVMLGLVAPNPVDLPSYYGLIPGYDTWLYIDLPNSGFVESSRQLRFVNSAAAELDADFASYTTGDIIADGIWYTLEIAWDNGNVTFKVLNGDTVIASWDSTYIPSRKPVDMVRSGPRVTFGAETGYQFTTDDAYLAVWVP